MVSRSVKTWQIFLATHKHIRCITYITKLWDAKPHPVECKGCCLGYPSLNMYKQFKHMEWHPDGDCYSDTKNDGPWKIYIRFKNMASTRVSICQISGLMKSARNVALDTSQINKNSPRIFSIKKGSLLLNSHPFPSKSPYPPWRDSLVRLWSLHGMKA